MIPLFDLKIYEAELNKNILHHIETIMKNAHHILGPYTQQFEEAFASYCGVEHAVAVNSGSSALHLALLAAGIGKGDEVITTPFTFIATAAAIAYTGATPVFVDIEKESYNIDPQLIRKAITHKTKAIIPVHLYGQMANMKPIMQLAKEFNLLVIEDVAQACGAKDENKMAGSIGDFGCYSFYPTKTLGAAGDAGMVVTHRQEYAEKLQLLRNCGKNPSGQFYTEAYNARISEIQAAVLLEKLKYLDEWNQRRIELAEHYIHLLKESDFKLPHKMPYTMHHVYSLFTLAHPDREEILQDLHQENIQAGIYYGGVLHLQPVFSYLNYQPGDFPNAEQAAREVLTLPIYPSLTKDNIKLIVDHLMKFKK